MRKKALIFMVVISAFCLSGCKRIELDDETEDAYVEYAVNAVINHDKNNMLKMERVYMEKEEETVWVSDEDIVDNKVNSEADVSEQVSYVSFEEALGTDALSVKVNGIKECSMYPENTGEELGFAMTATAGSRLVVLELDITNISQNAVTLDTTNGYSFKGMFNGIVRTNALLTVFDYALNNNSHTFTVGETKRMVLIYELNQERIPEITKFALAVTRNDVTYNVSVK